MPRNRHIAVNAFAGTGKSFTMKELFRRAAGLKPCETGSDEQVAIWSEAQCKGARKRGMMAFNKSTKEEWKREGIPGLECHTTYSFGLQCIYRNGIKTSLEQFKTQLLLEKVSGKSVEALNPALVQNVERLCSLVRLRLDEPEEYGDTAEEFGINYGEQTEEYLTKIVELHHQTTDTHDFTDMVWLPVKLGLRLQPYDFLGVDECLPGYTPVMLADGSSKTIKEIVDNKLKVRVRSMDVTTGKEVNSRIVGWQKLLNQKPLVKIRVRQSIRTGTNVKHNFVVCTTDHKIWCSNRQDWIPAGLVHVGDQVIVETAAITSQKGKITSTGRETLSQCLKGNERGNHARKTGRPPFQGGNGKPLPIAVQCLMEELGDDWQTEHVVLTGRHGKGYPSCYKIDIANPSRKIAVEVDGASHNSMRAKETDRKKDEFLTSKGWTVYRFANRDAIQRTAETVCKINGGKDCPIAATVVSIESVEIPDNHVYDITVENTHCFYANGILVHNCQDLNACQQELILSHGRRIMIVGDKRQAIYQFAGADEKSLDNLQGYLNDSQMGMTTLPLTKTRRCPKSVVKLANELVPELRPMEDADEGEIFWEEDVEWQKNLTDLHPEHDMVICRRNAPLVMTTLGLIRAKQPARMIGRDFGQNVVEFLERFAGRYDATIDILPKIKEEVARKEADWKKKKFVMEKTKEVFYDVALSSIVFCSMCKNLEEIKATIKEIFLDADKIDQKKFIRLSSIHRAKGLEAKSIHFLEQNKCGVAYEKTLKGGTKEVVEPNETDLNLRYVGITRSMNQLIMVNAPLTDNTERL